ncbi:hypothetical protein [Aliikangiella maris]|uniref:Uncharacterized protein n=2 Tax=Aliikangiella maris TaxID=3162458 RepID=A0ABV3MTX8_9GAMM
MTFKVEKIENGYAAYFPFDLKDSFKSVFKSAKWNRYSKRWEVGPRSKKRLDQWMDEAKELAKDIEVTEALEMTETELFNLRSELEKIKRSLAIEKGIQNKLSESIWVLSEAKNELDLLSKKLNDEKVITLQKQAQAKELLEKACRIENILDAQRNMARLIHNVGRVAREQYDEQLEIIKKTKENLASIGLKSKGIDVLYDMNFNRPDRDKPDDVKFHHLIEITEIEDDESN